MNVNAILEFISNSVADEHEVMSMCSSHQSNELVSNEQNFPSPAEKSKEQLACDLSNAGNFKNK